MIKAERYTSFWDIESDGGALCVELTIFLRFTGVDRKKSSRDLFLNYGMGAKELDGFLAAGWEVRFTMLPRPNFVFSLPYERYKELVGDDGESNTMRILATEMCDSIERVFDNKNK